MSTPNVPEEGGQVTVYRGFKIVLLPNHTLVAYRGEQYEKGGTASYAVNAEPEWGYYNEELGQLRGQIDEANDMGEFGTREPVEFVGQKYYETPAEAAAQSITSLGFTQRTQDALLRGGVQTLDQLRLMGDERLLTLRNFGQLSLQEVRRQVSEPQRDKTFVIHWAGSISWSGFSAEDAIEDFKANPSFGTFMKQFSHFEESKW